MTRIINIVYLVLGFMIGYSSATFLNGTGAVPVHPASVQSVSMLESEFSAKEKLFEDKTDSLARANFSLQQQVITSKRSLSKATTAKRELEGKIDALINENNFSSDTQLLLANCDTMEQVVQELIANNQREDTIYQSIISDLELQLQGKDSIGIVQQQKFDLLKGSFDKSIAQQEVLAQENTQYRKYFKRKKVKNRLLSAGAIILGGVAAYQLLK